MPITRRGFLRNGAVGLSALALSPMLARGQAGGALPQRKLLVVFLRGGADGLDLVVPRWSEAETKLQALRNVGSNAIYRNPNPALQLVTDTWELHPQLADTGMGGNGLLSLFQGGEMSIIHAVGNPQTSHSHFVAQDEWERAAPSNPSYTNGWLGQTLIAMDMGSGLTAVPKALSGVGISSSTPISLRAELPGYSIAFPSIAAAKLDGHAQVVANRRLYLENMFQSGNDPISLSARDAFTAIDALAALESPQTQNAGFFFESGGKDYLNRYFFDAARLLMNWDGSTTMPADPGSVAPGSDLGVRVALLDYGGWDTHSNQGARLAGNDNNVDPLRIGLRGFWDLVTDYGWDQEICVLVVSEFGRTVDMNQNFGTEHGAGGAAFLLSGHLATDTSNGDSGRVVTQGPGPNQFPDLSTLGTKSLDLDPTTDFRDVYQDILTNHFGLSVAYDSGLDAQAANGVPLIPKKPDSEVVQLGLFASS